MAHQFQFNVTDNQYKALQLAFDDPDTWASEIVRNEAKVMLARAVATEMERLLEANLPIPQTRGEILDSALAAKQVP